MNSILVGIWIRFDKKWPGIFYGWSGKKARNGYSPNVLYTRQTFWKLRSPKSFMNYKKIADLLIMRHWNFKRTGQVVYCSSLHIATILCVNKYINIASSNKASFGRCETGMMDGVGFLAGDHFFSPCLSHWRPRGRRKGNWALELGARTATSKQ